MKLTTRARRRTMIAAAIASAAILLPAVALASSAGSGSASGAAQPRAAAYPRCARSWLTSWIGIPGDATAGSTYYQLELSNISSRTCKLNGFPAVIALRNHRRQIGNSSGHIAGHTDQNVVLQPQQTAHAVLQIIDVGNLPSAACDPTTANALRVIAPFDTASMKIPFPFTFRACSRQGPNFLYVSRVIAGTGIPGYSH